MILSVKTEVKAEVKQENPSERKIFFNFTGSAKDRLVKEERLNRPLKRRPSSSSNQDSRANSPELKSYHKRIRYDSSQTSSDNSSIYKRSKNKYEKDPTTLARRQKQIDYGKNTIGYNRYIQLVPKEKRRKYHPRTPAKFRKYSRRNFDGIVKIWRIRLHEWDPPESEYEK